MTTREPFQAALGLSDPWRVDRMEFDPAEHRLDLYLDFERGARFPCPEGDQASCAVHDTTEKTWRHLDFFQNRAYLHARVPRIAWPAHGVRQVEVAWARPGSGFSLLFEALLMALLAEMPVKAVAELVGEHDTRLWRILHHYVEGARASLSMRKVRAVGIDETSCGPRGAESPSVMRPTDGRRSDRLKLRAVWPWGCRVGRERPDNVGTGRHRQTARVRQARRECDTKVHVASGCADRRIG